MKKRMEREEARALHLEGKSYNEIAKILSVSKSTISLWCSDLAVEKRARLADNRRVRLKREAKVAQEKKAKTPRIGVPAEAPFAGFTAYHYAGKDGVKRVQLAKGARPNVIRKSLSLARYLMSVHLGRELSKDELVAHRDNDTSNDDIGNLVITTWAGKGLLLKEKNRRDCVICEESFLPARPTVETCSRPCRSILVSGILTGRKKVPA